jgi:hypothetical protein
METYIRGSGSGWKKWSKTAMLAEAGCQGCLGPDIE